MLACNRTLHHLQAQFPLSRSTFIITERQTRITANLTQTHQLCQNLYFALRKLFFTLRLHQFERFHNLPIIKSLLLGIKACDTHLFDFSGSSFKTSFFKRRKINGAINCFKRLAAASSLLLTIGCSSSF